MFRSSNLELLGAQQQKNVPLHETMMGDIWKSHHQGAASSVGRVISPLTGESPDLSHVQQSPTVPGDRLLLILKGS